MKLPVLFLSILLNLCTNSIITYYRWPLISFIFRSMRLLIIVQDLLLIKQSYYLPKTRTNYGIFNIRFQGVKIYNSLEENVKSLSFSQFKKRIKIEMIQKY